MRYLISILLLTSFYSKNYGQCDNGTNFFPAAVSTGVWASATMVNWAGEVTSKCHSGDIYQFSTCNIYGVAALMIQNQRRDNAGNHWLTMMILQVGPTLI